MALHHYSTTALQWALTDGTTALQLYSTTPVHHYSGRSLMASIGGFKSIPLPHYSTPALHQQYTSKTPAIHYHYTSPTALQHFSSLMESTSALQHSSTTALQHFSTTELQLADGEHRTARSGQRETYKLKRLYFTRRQHMQGVCMRVCVLGGGLTRVHTAALDSYSTTALQHCISVQRSHPRT